MRSEAEVEGRVLVGRYRLGPLLGEGGMAKVHEALDERLGRQVAVKLLQPALAGREEVRARFEAEARAAARLVHPNVVQVYDTGEDDGLPFLVMERLPGETLADRIAAGPADQAWLVRVAGDVLQALGAAHAAGIVHRDVKPGNILLAADGCAKVADFGIAKSIESTTDVDLTAPNLLLGTPAYLAPERVEGRPADARSDLYALGVVLYEALGGKRPFTGSTPMSVAYKVAHEVPAPLREVRPDVDPRLEAAVERLMAREPDARPAHAREALALLPRPSDLRPGEDGTIIDGLAAAATTLIRRPDEREAAGATTRDSSVRVRSSRSGPARWPAAVLAASIALLLLIGVVAAARGRGDGGAAGSDPAAAAPAAAAGEAPKHPLSGELRSVADRLADGDGPKGRDAAERLRAIAGTLDSGDEARAGELATELAREAAGWCGERSLGTSACRILGDVVAKVPGVDLSAVATTPAPAPSDEKDDEGKGGGKGGGKGKDD